MTASPEVGRPPEGTLRRALADAFHAANHEAWETCEPGCGGRLTRDELSALDAAAREWLAAHPTRRLARR